MAKPRQRKSMMVEGSGNGNAIYIEEVDITPEMAGEYLRRNPHNRFPSETRVRRYAEDMSNGRWMLTHQPIAFDEEDDLLDGQQRLLAIQRSNTTQRFLVAYGAPRQTFFLVDTGKPRNLGDALTIRGEVNARRQGSAVNLHWRVTEGRDGRGNPAPNNPTTIIALEHYDDVGEQAFRDAVSAGGHVYHYIRGPMSAYAGLYPVLSDIDLEDADWFFDHLATGHSLAKTHPVGVLRNTLIQHVRDVPVTYDRIFLSGLMIKAWNFYRRNEEIEQLQFRRGGATPERFPYPE